MQDSDLELKIFFAIKFIVRPLAVPDQVVIDAAEAATREIVRHQKQLPSEGCTVSWVHSEGSRGTNS